MRYQQISPELFIENRRRFTEQLPPGSLCILHANDVAPTNADGTRAFIQNSDLFWLTGIDQEETILILFPDAPVPERREMLFVRQTNEHLAIWEGPKLSKQAATGISGIPVVHWTSTFEGMLKRVFYEAESIWLNSERHGGRNPELGGRNHRFIQWCREHYPLLQYRDAAPVLHRLRMIKSPVEINLMRTAVQITKAGFLAACSAVRDGIYEYEIEAECARAFIARGARGFAYEPIIASGERSCILHYISNDHRMHMGDVLLLDIGASYANYAADMTRTIPVGGTFTARQRAIYQGVMQIFTFAKQMMRPGVLPADYHQSIENQADEVLVDLGLLSLEEVREAPPDRPARNQYFLHRTAHFLGIDVHDPGDAYAPFAPGMVLTCEPGIYVREEGIGVRIENDILITADGHEDLMADIPIELDDIESLMHASS